MRRSLGRAVAMAAMAVVSSAVLIGCGSGGGSGDSGAVADGGAGLPEPAGPGAGEDAGGGAVDTDEDRQIVTTASASVAVEDPARAAQQVSELVEAVGGRVEERAEYAGNGEPGRDGGSADLVVRVPADALTDVLADLADIGEVASRTVSRSDVTATAVDLDARIRALQTSVERLQALMSQAGSVEDLLAAEETLSERQAELESLQSQRALLADQVELSTLNVHLEPFGVAPAGGPDGFVDGLGTGWRALVSALAAVVVVLGVLLPWLGLVAVIGAGVLVPIRMSRRRSAATPPPQPPVPQPTMQHPPMPPPASPPQQ